MKNIFITGSAGFIGANLVIRLLKTEDDINIVGLDNMNDYYEVSLKEYRLHEIDTLLAQQISSRHSLNYKFIKGDLADKALIDSLFEQYQFDVVVNLAAQAGVRNSIDYLEGRLAEVC